MKIMSINHGLPLAFPNGICINIASLKQDIYTAAVTAVTLHHATS